MGNIGPILIKQPIMAATLCEINLVPQARRGLFPFTVCSPDSDSVKQNLRDCTTSSNSRHFLKDFS